MIELRLWLCQRLVPKDTMILGPGVWGMMPNFATKTAGVEVGKSQSIVGSTRWFGGHRIKWKEPNG